VVKRTVLQVFRTCCADKPYVTLGKERLSIMVRSYLISGLLFLPTMAGIGLLHSLGRGVTECIFFLLFAAVWHFFETATIIKGRIYIRTCGIGLIERSKNPASFWFGLLPFSLLYVFFFWIYPSVTVFLKQ